MEFTFVERWYSVMGDITDDGEGTDRFHGSYACICRYLAKLFFTKMLNLTSDFIHPIP